MTVATPRHPDVVTKPTAERAYVLPYRGTDIVIIDLSHTAPNDALPIMTAAGDLIATFPLKSVRAYTDGTGAVYSKDSYNALKEFTVKNTPYILASAVIGADGLRAAALRAVALLTGRNIRHFSRRVDALDWLASVPAHPTD